MKNSIDGVGFPKPPEKPVGKSELIEDSQELMWEQLVELKEELKRENSITEKGHPFLRGQIERVMISTERLAGSSQSLGLEKVAGWYEMSKEDLLKRMEGKKVLDIGSNKSTFAKEAQEKVNCEVVSLDVKEDILKDKNSAVVARGEKLPFMDQSFDEVFATFSLPYWAMDEKQINDFFREAIRVVRVNGYINITPVATIQNRYISSTRFPGTVSNNPYAYIANKIQIETIDALQKLKEGGNVEIVLARNYKAAEERDRERLKKYPPALVTIKKLR
ncbi:MAG: methyltransferase domain-containing protein [Patescibacteria group bacterium]|nr:methyltransferase domain-containing protein [Patescibacteria group bacterium]